MRSLVWLVYLLFLYHQLLCVLALIPVEFLYVFPVSLGIDGSPRLMWSLFASCQGPGWLPDCWKEYVCSKLRSPFSVFSIMHALMASGFGGLAVACWPLVPKFADSNPAEAVGFFRVKKSSARLPSEGK